METEEVSCPEVGSSEDVCLSNPQLPTDLLENQNEQLRGDAIGNTLYSERFVLKTLIKLSQVKEEDWCKDFENDLCYLWDMTVEDDVVSLLMNHDFLTLATSLLKGPVQKHRFIEIMVGILRNMCCNENVRKKLSHKTATTKLLMKLLLSPDALTLIQLVRLLNSIAWDLVKEVDQRNCKKQHWLEKQMDRRRFCNRLMFILNSSTNEDLLCSVLDVLNTLCTYGLTLNDKDFSQYFATPRMVGSLIECWHQLFNVPSLTTTVGDTEYTVENLVGSSDNELLLDKHKFRMAKKWVAIVASFTGHENGRTAVVACGGHVTKIMCRLLSTSDEDERCEEMMTDAVNILEALIPTHFVPHILRRMLLLYDRVTHSQAELMDEDGEGSSLPVETLMLIETLENYFESVLRNTKKPLLLEALDRCDNHMVALFWSTVHKRCMELASDWNSNEDDERTI